MLEKLFEMFVHWQRQRRMMKDLRTIMRHSTRDEVIQRFVSQGCTRVESGTETILTTPNGKGKIVVGSNYLAINPQVKEDRQRYGLKGAK